MKRIFILLIILFIGYFLLAEHVPFEEARKIAQNWVQILNASFRENVALANGEPLIKKGSEIAHVFHLLPTGFVLVSAEDYLPPIKMYSTKNNFGREGRLLEEHVCDVQEKIVRLVKRGDIQPETVFSQKNKNDFDFMRKERPVAMLSEAALQDVGPYLKTGWGQGYPFNSKCPLVNGQYPPAGCVATAFSQIMYYFKYPSAGQGSHSYLTDTHHIPLSASFDHAYHWESMQLNYNSGTATQEQKDAVAELLFDVGVAFEMDYDSGGSGAYSQWGPIVLPAYFKYSSDIKEKYREDVANDDDWFNIAKEQLDKTLPLQLSMYTYDEDGHSVVIDGYRISSGSTTFHINMGWDGSYNSYYSLNNIQTGGYNFNKLEWQYYVYDIYPPDYFAVMPPQNVTGQAFLNRSLFLTQYVCKITWEASLSGDLNLSHYAVMQKDSQQNESELAQISVDEKTHTFRVKDYKANSYGVVAVGKTGQRSIVRYFNLELKQ